MTWFSKSSLSVENSHGTSGSLNYVPLHSSSTLWDLDLKTKSPHGNPHKLLLQDPLKPVVTSVAFVNVFNHSFSFHYTFHYYSWLQHSEQPASLSMAFCDLS
ncbi:hypothetical protein ILYODFUR_013311 [Ilyodon furcidens]|uniref:Uncharacterized protein n=1 Tax=Ilyodon furcidens TaxID=33524 RepID=A0ABV0UH62_9TELE